MTKRLLAIPLLLCFIGALATPAATAKPDAEPNVDAGMRVTITFVSDVRDNGESTWFDALGRPRTQAKTPLAESLGSAALWSSTWRTPPRPRRARPRRSPPAVRFAWCTILVDDEVRATDTVTTSGGRATCQA